MAHSQQVLKSDLIDGAYYKGKCRNATIARWNADIDKFVYWRTKFGSKFTETICHLNDDPYYDVFIAYHICEPEEDIPFDK
jgi:hypothetical protein